MKRLKYFLNNLKSLLRTKIIFSKPHNAEILLFDYINKDIFKNSFKDFTVEVLYLRLESINIFILYKTILLFGFRNCFKNYIKTYINYVKPKTVITFNELHPTFYLLKDFINNKNITYIAIQDGFRTLPNFKSFKLKSKNKYKADIIFIFSKKNKQLYSKFFNSNFFFLGSFRNNYFKKKIIKKKNQILLISQYRKEYRNTEKNKYFFREKKLLTFLKRINQKFNIKFLIANKPGVSKKEYCKTFNLSSKTEIIYSKNFKEKYKIVDISELTLFMDSTLGMEAMSRGNKVISFPFKPYKEIKKFFWDSKLNYQDFEKKIISIFSMNEKVWKKKINNNEVFLNYNPENKNLKKIIKNLI